MEVVINIGCFAAGALFGVFMVCALMISREDRY